MEVSLYNSTVCRLCGEENDSGTLLYSADLNNQNLSDLINTYLPIKVSDDGELPRTICPGCTIQLEATVEFLNLIVAGQKVIRELHQREVHYKKTILNAEDDKQQVITEKLVCEINTDMGIYHLEHPISLQMAGLERPKRKRGRPPKKPKSPEEIEQECVAKETEIEAKKVDNDWSISGKRRRKTPTRFKEAVQGKELERIFKEEGVIDGEESEAEVKMEPGVKAKPVVREPEVIGHLETSGELVVVVKGKGRGRPRGRMRQTREECLICGMTFSCVGRYMAHVAQHGPVRYRCVCGALADTRLDHENHQKETGHTGHTVLQDEKGHKNLQAENANSATIKLETEENAQELKEETNEITNDEIPIHPLAGVINDVIPETASVDINPVELMNLVGNRSEPHPNINNGNGISEKPSETVTKPEETKVVGRKGKAKLKCNQCDKYFSSKQSKSMHIKAVHIGEKPYSCSECFARFAYPRCLALHKLSHRRGRHQRNAQPRQYACDLCGKVLNHPSSVVYHKEAEHAGQRYVCGKCGKCFKHRQLLQRHQLVHSQLRPYSCKTCTATFKTRANLLNHQLLHSGLKKFTCDICKHKFAHKTSLTLHMRWHTGTKPYACKVCGKSFSQKGNLSEHERIHTGEKPFQCSICPKRFTTSSQYRLHTHKHQHYAKYACGNCPKRLLTRGAWLSHTRTCGAPPVPPSPAPAPPAAPPAPPPPPASCAVCSRKFADRWSLSKHMRRHTGERPFRCNHCPRAFADCSNLNKHKKQVHKQVSLLVNSDNSQLLDPAVPVVGEEETITIADVNADVNTDVNTDADADDMESVVYITYDADEGATGFHMMEAGQAVGMKDDDIEALSESDLADLHQSSLAMAVTDEHGNPLHFTMQDGTRLAITSADGKSLQVITQDGQTIPVEINEFDEEEVEATEDEVVLSLKDTMDAEVDSPVTHYFTIV